MATYISCCGGCGRDVRTAWNPSTVGHSAYCARCARRGKAHMPSETRGRAAVKRPAEWYNTFASEGDYSEDARPTRANP